MIGRSAPRTDARDKITGRTRYVADLDVPGAWAGVTVRSAVPAGRIVRIAAAADFPATDAVLVTGAGLGARNRVAMVTDEMPFLAVDSVRYLGEPVALVAAPDLEAARAAAQCVEIEIEPLPAVLALAEAERRWRADPAAAPPLAEYRITRGDAAAALRDSPIVVTGEYATPAQEQAYIEPQGMLALPRADGSIVLEGSLQCPYYIHSAIVRLLACAPEQVIVRQAPTGGAFGGKEDFPSLLAGHAALLARACGRPVRMLYDRHEDLLFTTKRHPSITRHRTGLSAKGELLAMEIEVLMDGGAYTTLSPVVLSRGLLHATGPYTCPNVSAHGICLPTNVPPAGAFRGFGAPQTLFAIETHMDRAALHCGLRPDEIRRRNLVRAGSVTATGQTLRESVGAEPVLDAALQASDFVRVWETGALPAPRARRRRGIGLSLVWHGGGFTGSGEVHLTSRVALTVEADDRLLIRVANVEMGQGCETTLPQIVAARLGLPLARVACAQPDTSRVPNSGPTVASRTVMVVGALLDDCARQLEQALGQAWARRSARPAAPGLDGSRAAEVIDFDRGLAALRSAGGPLRFEAQYAPPPGIHWDDATYRGDAYAAYSYACTVVEVEVDVETGEVRVERIVSANDVGRAINPQIVEGQIEGGTVQALGLALTERLTVREGRYEQGRFQTYMVPTACDAPEIDTILIDNPYPGGPGGAKGAGELPMDGPAPAIANAVARAIGVRFGELPITPELVLAALRAGEGDTAGLAGGRGEP
jgi:CO/xanthine dehydrogenase Mo-binding subunit